jgi:hypothetical protein
MPLGYIRQMRHLKTYALFESETELTKEQIQFLKKGTRKRKKNWSLNSEGKVDVEGNFDCSRQDLTDFKGVKFGRVSGDFDCCNNSLATLEGAPESVGGKFYCSFNSLTTLKGAPETVGGNFYCVDNSLTTLKGGPKTVGGDFICSKNSLTTLEGGPKEVGGEFWCYGNSLATLKGAPETIGGIFDCDAFETSNWTFEGKLKIMETGTPEVKALILTAISPEFIQQKIDKSPEEMTVALKSIWKELKKDPRYSTIKLPKGLEKKADLLSDLGGIGL